MALYPDLIAKLDSANEHYEAVLASERDRATRSLAEMICDPIAPEKSIGELEKPGEEKLRIIVEWLGQSK
jgi:hypothetical protein